MFAVAVECYTSPVSILAPTRLDAVANQPPAAMPSLTKTLVCLAATCNGFLAPAPQRPATVLQAATIAAKDVSALRKASGPDPVQKMQKTAPSNWSRGPLGAGRARCTA